jgi:hypothetical protein
VERKPLVIIPQGNFIHQLHVRGPTTKIGLSEKDGDADEEHIYPLYLNECGHKPC